MQPVSGFPSCSTKNKLMKMKTFSWQGFWQVSNVDLCWCSQWVIISAQPAMGEAYIFSFCFSLGRGRATLQHIIYSTTWFNCQRGKRSQPIVQGLYMDWTLGSKFPCLKNVNPALSLWHSCIWKFYTWNLASKGRPKSPLRSDTNEGHLFCTLKKEFAALWSRIFY